MKIKKIGFAIFLIFFTLSFIQIASFASAIAEKTKENGIYKIALGIDTSKTIEVAGSDTYNNAKVDIWNYRKCSGTKVLFVL